MPLCRRRCPWMVQPLVKSYPPNVRLKGFKLVGEWLTRKLVNHLLACCTRQFFDSDTFKWVLGSKRSIATASEMLFPHTIQTMMVDGCNICTFFSSTTDAPTTLIPNYHHYESRATHHFLSLGKSCESTTWGIIWVIDCYRSRNHKLHLACKQQWRVWRVVNLEFGSLWHTKWLKFIKVSSCTRTC